MKWLSGIITILLVIQVYGNPRHVRESPEHEHSATDSVKELLTQVKTNTDNLVKQISEQIEQVKAQNPQIQEAWDAGVAKVKDAFQEINSHIPDAKEHAETLQATIQEFGTHLKEGFEKALKTVTEQSDNVQEQFATNFKNTVDHLVEDVQKANTKIQEAVAKYQEKKER